MTADTVRVAIGRAADTSLNREDRTAVELEIREHITLLLPAARRAVGQLDRAALEWSRGMHRLDLIRDHLTGRGRLTHLAADCAWLLNHCDQHL